MRIPAILYDEIIASATRREIDPLIIAAICAQESGCNPYPPAGDGGNSHGPMQLHVRGAGHGHPLAELKDPVRNIQIGADYIADAIARYPDDLPRAITAYNWPAYAGSPNYSGPSTYARAVLTILDQLDEEDIQRIEPTWTPERRPSTLELIDAVWGFLRDAARASTADQRDAAMCAGQDHLIALKDALGLNN
jgi:hypothetical protein